MPLEQWSKMSLSLTLLSTNVTTWQFAPPGKLADRSVTFGQARSVCTPGAIEV